MTSGAPREATTSSAVRMPPRLPRLPPNLGGWAKALIVALWAAALGLALVAIFVGTRTMIAGNSGPLLIVAWLLPSMLFVIAAASFWLKRASAVALLLSMSFLLIGATNFSAQLFWMGSFAALREGLANVGWFGFIVGLLVFPKGAFTPRWSIYVAIAAAAFLAVDTMRAFLWPDDKGLAWAGAYTLLGFFGGSAGVLMLRLLRTPFGLEHHQLKWALAGIAMALLSISAGSSATVVASLVEAGHLPAEMATLVVGYLVPIGFLFLGLGMLIALSGYGLRSADVLISGSVILSLLGLGLTALFAVARLALETFLPAAAAQALGGALTVVALVPAQSWLRSWVRRRFPDALDRLSETTAADLKELDGLVGGEDLLDEVLCRVSHGLRAEHAAVILDGALKSERNVSAADVGLWLAAESLPDSAHSVIADRDPIFPLRLPLRVGESGAGVPLGWLLIGPRLDGGRYRKADRNAVDALAGPIARAIRKTQIREGRERI